MNRILLIASLLVLSLGVLAQQQAPPPYDQQPPPVQTPPTFPEDQDPGARPIPPDMPPDTRVPPAHDLSNSEVQDQIQTKLHSEPALDDNRLRVEVTDAEVVVSGTPDNEKERDLALRIAESYAGERRVVDKMEIKGKA